MSERTLVDITLADEDHLAKREEYLQTVVLENFKAYGLVKTQYEVDKIDMLDLLLAQSKWYRRELPS